jgi:hypothetical protein
MRVAKDAEKHAGKTVSRTNFGISKRNNPIKFLVIGGTG